MQSYNEPNSIFGGFSAPEWRPGEFEYNVDPENLTTWLFKLTNENDKISIH